MARKSDPMESSPTLENPMPDAEQLIRTASGASQLRLINRDCVEGMAALKPGSVDVVVTSPPYNLGIQYEGFDDGGSRDEYLAWTRRWFEAVKRLLGPQGSFFLNVGSRPKDPWVPFEVLGVARDQFQLQNVFHWVKSISVMKEDAGRYPAITDDVVVGHYKPINSKRFVNDCHEYIFHLTHKGDVPLDRLALGVPYQDKSNVARWASTGGRDLHCRGNTWFIPYETIRHRATDRPHPATFPSRLPEMCLRIHGLERVSSVLDPFMGLGNTGVACTRLGKDFIGFEKVESYFLEAARRLENGAD
jgi:site-specific DNA-methyltransferase (adenine-specific)